MLYLFYNKNRCKLKYIPRRLKQKSRKKIEEFYLHEELYWRCSKNDFENPYKSVGLYDISINRQGRLQNPISKPEDVLYDITDSLNQKYKTSYIVLKIDVITKPHYYKKKVDYKDDNIYQEAIIELLHDPLPCMYPHSIFRFIFENKIITKDNYKSTFGKKSQKRLRQKCRDSLTRMIVDRRVVFD